MAFEREHKFRVSGDFPGVRQLTEQYAALGVTLRPRGSRTQRDVYYDTPSLTLSHAGVALRVRHLKDQDGEQTLATYKGAGVVNGSLHTREELELPCHNFSDGDFWPPEILAKLEPLGVVNTLAPLLELVTERQRYLLLESKQAQAELSFDEVTSTRGAQSVTFRELELEALSETSERDLETLARPLKQPGLVPHAEDKLTLALRLLEQLSSGPSLS